jgi:hypothetical protein
MTTSMAVRRRAVRGALSAMFALIATCWITTPADAAKRDNKALDDETLGYIESNTLAIFYHELGHALIDVLNIPIYGQEEDAADVLSVVLFDEIYEKEDSDLIAYDAALSMLIDAEWNDDGGEAPFWDVHGLDLQRFYTLICLHYGGSPETRENFRVDFELPDERAAGCADERALAESSWGGILDEIENEATGSAKFKFVREHEPGTEAQSYMLEILQDEVTHWNTFVHLPEIVTVSFVLCDKVNAFYDPELKAILICAEYADYLVEQYRE